ncbi:hypothetical protein KR018_011740 [Drosophila ironensis]|nr:hypothetical protein KR018_011740 [Drosophila ironensis]
MKGDIPCYSSVIEANDTVTMQITNLDYSLDESSLRSFLMNQLKPITPVVSLVFEGSSYAKVTVPDLYFAKQVVSNLHRKKIGHKRMLVSYTRDSSLTEINTLRCQVAGLLKDVPYYTLPMYKFRELFQSRFKTSISVLDLYKMQDICIINSDNNEDKFISLQPELVNTLESSPLMEGLQHSVPYCTVHFKREQHKGWAEQEIEPLPNVFMTISDVQKLIYPLLKLHPGDIPVATLLHCIEEQLKVPITADDNGVNLEHLVCCVQGIQIQVNNFGIKILGWLELNKEQQYLGPSLGNQCLSERFIGASGNYLKNSVGDPLYQISREVIELVKMSPKATMKFNRFIPAYHNHFGKQCRVADYGYTKLIELFEALSSVVQIMGDGENRHITLTHRTQIRRFTSDLLRVLRLHSNNSVLLSQLPTILAHTHNKNFDVTDYGVCDIIDILDGLVNSNIVVLSPVNHGKDILISMPKRKQTSNELEKTGVFAGEMVELLQNALQYTILFQKFVRSYHYHFAYQCRLSDYGFLKLADLMDAIHGLVEMEVTNDEEKKILLSPNVARRVFADQCCDLIRNFTGSSTNAMRLDQILKLHKKKYGYQIQPHALGASDITAAVNLLPYVEVKSKDRAIWLIYHNDDMEFRHLCYRACKHIIQLESCANAKNEKLACSGLTDSFSKSHFLNDFNNKYMYQITESALSAMRHAIEIYKIADVEHVRLTAFMRFLISIIRLLEHQPNMYLYEIKSQLECGLATTFRFGYPNLYKMLDAHKDLFTMVDGPTHEKCYVSLKVNCECKRVQSNDSIPLTFNDLSQTSQLHKTQNSFSQYSLIDEFNSSLQHSLQSYKDSTSATDVRALPVKFSPPSSNSSLLGSFGSENRNSLNNKENSSLQLFNSSFNSSGDLNASLGAGDLTNITSHTAVIDSSHVESSSKLWNRRHNRFYQKPLQDQLQKSGSAIGDLHDLVSTQTESIGANYGPPKPDTPPKDKLPFWIDPIWSNTSEQPRQNILNIRLPELKANHVFPMLLSPYTISKNENIKRQLLNINNHDRKIT